MRVPDLYAFQRAIAQCSCADVSAVRSTAVLVATHAAGAQLRHTLENLLLLPPGSAGRTVLVLPQILTRDGWYERLHGAEVTAPRLLAPVEREVLMARAAREAIDAGHRPPFQVRPALVAEMLALLDTLLRLGRTLDAFERLVVEKLEPSVPIDRGAESLLDQTRFLVTAFRRYRQLAAASGAVDEHDLRERLLARDTPAACSRVVVTVGDRQCGAGGLWPVDFDLLARLPHLSEVDVVATENVLAAGLHERLQDWLPGFEEVDFGQPAAVAGRVPVLVTPAGDEKRWWTSRDREEELTEIARLIKSRTAATAVSLTSLDRTAVVCKRPLPYVYLAQSCLGAAGIPFQAFDDLPLAAEPFAAAVDLVFRCLETRFARRPVVALLLSPHFVFEDDEGPVPPGCVRALDVALRNAGSGDVRQPLAGLVERGNGPETTPAERAALRAADVARCVIAELAPLTDHQPASQQCERLIAFLDAHTVTPDPRSPVGMRTARARGAVAGALRQFRAAHRAHDDPDADVDSFVSKLRRWMEAQTFSPRTGREGVHLLDADAARYGDFDDVHLVGVIEREWPDNAGRTIFYPLTLLNQLGWPPERLRLAAARAAFKDLVRLAGRHAWVSSFVLEDDAIVEPSPLLDELDRSGLAAIAADPPPGFRMLPDEALSLDPVRSDVVGPAAGEWVRLRQRRTLPGEPQFHGCTGPLVFAPHAVRRLETYLDCPFKYFAETVLGLPDERDDDPTEGPRAQGLFLHEVLSTFFERWQADGRGSITTANVEEARVLFRNLVRTRVEGLPRAEGEMWRARLLGTPARPGVGETVFRAEVAAGGTVTQRLLEFRFAGACRLEADSVSRTVTLRGVADRIDVLDGSRLRILDYKLGRAPNVHRAIQLPVYAVQACEQLARDGRALALTDAAYLAFGERDAYVPLATRGLTLDAAVAEGQQRAMQAIDGVERGAFPPRPAEPFQCGYCPYAAVCRKDYVDDE